MYLKGLTRQDVFNALKFWEKSPQKVPQYVDDNASLSGYTPLQAFGYWPTNYQYGVWNGEKYPGGFGPTQINWTDYYSLRLKSRQLFIQNKYARGIIRRLITNEIAKGLVLESDPVESVIGVEEDSLTDWADNTEVEFKLWGDNKEMVDYARLKTWGEIQSQIRLESLAGGDCLVLIHVSKRSGLPMIQIVPADRLVTPVFEVDVQIPDGHRIIHGVQVNERGEHVKFFVQKPFNAFEYDTITARGGRSGRLKAFLVYGTEKRTEDVRGVPLLSLIMQSLNDLDKYKDAALKKALVNSILAMFITKDSPKVGSNSIRTAMNRQTTVIDDSSYNPARYDFDDGIPGAYIQTLQEGEDIKPHSTAGTDVNFANFEEAVIAGISWALEMPPEILRLSFSSNYSASQAAINEFKIYLMKARYYFSMQVNQPVYETWLVMNEAKRGLDSNGILAAYRNRTRDIKFQAWVNADWLGPIKPSTDMLKAVNAYKEAVRQGFTDRTRASRDLFGTNFVKNVKKLTKENEALAEAWESMIEQEGGADVVNSRSDSDND